MANLNLSIFNELNMGAAQDFDGMKMPSLSADFGAQVGNNFDKVASEIQLGMPSM